MALQPTRRPRFAKMQFGRGEAIPVQEHAGTGRSLRSLGSRLNAQPLGAAVAIIVFGLVMEGCAANRAANLSSVSGLVVDDHGIRLPGATVRVTYTVGGATQVTTTTSPDGEYDVQGIRRGVYQLSAALPGFDLIETLEVTLPREVSVRAPVLRLKPRALAGPVAAGRGELIKAQLAVLSGLFQRFRKSGRNLLIAIWDDSDTDFKSPPLSLVEGVSTLTDATVRPLPEERGAAYHAIANRGDFELLVVAEKPDAASPSLVLMKGFVEVHRRLWWFRLHLKPAAGGWVADEFVKLGIAGP